MPETITYEPRNEFVILRIDYVGKLRKVAVPDSSDLMIINQANVLTVIKRQESEE